MDVEGSFTKKGHSKILEWLKREESKGICFIFVWVGEEITNFIYAYENDTAENIQVRVWERVESDIRWLLN